jgi:hypothetical protein
VNPEQSLGIDTPCPDCEVDHLHIDLAVATNGRYVTAGQEEDGTLLIREDPRYPLELTASISCCACDFYEDRPMRLV